MKKLVIGGASALVVGAAGAGLYLGSASPASAGDAELASASEQVAGQMANEPIDQQTTPQKPGQQADQKPGQRARQRIRARRLARRAGVHGEATVRTKNKGFVQIAWQRGQVTGKSGSTLTVRSLDGTVWSWQTDGTTRVRKDGQKSAVANLATNDFVVIAGQAASGNKHMAKAVVVPKKVPAKATQTPTPAPTRS
ncbi:MAG: hypothetical protein ACRDP6_01395 [Actinoallomurus sp.]